MKKVNMNLEIERDLKERVEYLFDELGLDIKTAVTMFFKQCVREQGFPFIPSLDVGLVDNDWMNDEDGLPF